MARWVIRYRRGREVTPPLAVATFANDSDRPPVVVIVFGFEIGDVAVGHREIDQRKQSGVLPHVELPCRRHFACDPVPTLGRTFVPKAGDLALFGGPRDTLASADRLDLFNICKSTRAVYRRGLARAELSGRLQHKRRYAAPVCLGCRLKVRRRRAVVATLRTRGVLHGPILTVVFPCRKDCRGSSSPNLQTGCFFLTIGDGAKHFLQSRVTSRLRVWEQSDDRIVSGSSDCCLD